MRFSFIQCILFPAVALATCAIHANEEIYDYLLKSTVWVTVVKPGEESFGSGTGSLIDEDERLVVTSAHVVEGASDAVLYFPRFDDRELIINPRFYLGNNDRFGIHARVVLRDASRDLALLRLDYLPFGVSSLPISEGSPPRGSRVHVVGNPGTSQSLWVYSAGHVRQMAKARLDSDSEYAASVIEVQSLIWQGNSGGPVVNDSGDLVGVVSRGVVGKDPREEALYCISSTEVRTIFSAYLDDRESTLNRRETRPDSILYKPTNPQSSGKLVVVNYYRPDVAVTVNGKAFLAPWGQSELWVPYGPVEAHLPEYQSKQIWDDWRRVSDHYEMKFRIER